MPSKKPFIQTVRNKDAYIFSDLFSYEEKRCDVKNDWEKEKRTKKSIFQWGIQMLFPMSFSGANIHKKEENAVKKQVFRPTSHAKSMFKRKSDV